MVDIKKAILYIIVALLGITLFNDWMRDYPVILQKHSKSVSTESNGKTPADYSPSTFTPGVVRKARNEVPLSALHRGRVSGGQLVKVKTDVLELTINTQGGDIVSAKLPKYPVSLEEKRIPIQILSDDTEHLYVAQSGLTNLHGKVPVHYTAKKKQYELADNRNELTIQLTAQALDGLHITKTYIFHRDDYAVQVAYQVHNTRVKPWKGSLYAQIIRREPSFEHRHFYARSYNGAAISSPRIPYKKVTYEAMDKQNIDRTSKDGWVSMQQHYFLSAWIPGNPDFMYRYYSHVIPSRTTGPNFYVIGFVSPQMNLASGGVATSHATFYVGPEAVKRLKALASDLDRVIDYGWLWPISTLLFWVMSAIHAVVKNWGWTIVLTTILIKIVFYWFSAKSFRSMARMREVQPRLETLKERYAGDQKALSRATMELYRKEKINPLGGCLPMLIQIPVFIAFYYVIIESVELRQAPFILWIHDLSVKDPHYILPILMGLSMLAQQWLSPTPLDPAQQKMMWILPVVFTVFFINFPAGLVLYWLINNVVQTLQQWYVNKTYENREAKLKIRCEKKKK